MRYIKKFIGSIFAFFFPVISFAQEQSYRIMKCFNGRCEYNGFESHNLMFGWIWMLVLPLLWITIILGAFVFWILMLVDAIKHSSDKMKIVWVLVIVFTYFIGALIYYFVEKRPRDKANVKSELKKEEVK